MCEIVFQHCVTPCSKVLVNETINHGATEKT